MKPYYAGTELNPIAGTIGTAFDLMVGNADLYIILFICMLGGLVFVISMAGGSAAYGKWASSKIQSKKLSLAATAFLGMMIFIDDYFNCLTVGTVMQPLTDKYQVSTQLPYALTVAGCCMAGYITAGLCKANIILTLSVSFTCLAAAIFVLHRIHRKSVSCFFAKPSLDNSEQSKINIS